MSQSNFVGKIEVGSDRKTACQASDLGFGSEAALDAGALGAALSGAGPTMLACVEDEGDAVGKAMELAWEKKGIAAESRILQVDDVGLQVERNER